MRKLSLALFVFFLIFSISSQDVQLSLVNAKNEFVWGVKFFNQGLYEKSVFSFEKSLSYDSSDFNTNLWLGKAYYMKGDVEAALRAWAILRDNNKAPLWLENTIDVVSSQIGVVNRIYETTEWINHYKLDVKRASSLLTMDDGSTMVVSFLENQLLHVNANGAIINRFNGGIEKFNRPFDVIAYNNNFIVTEFMGDKVSLVNDFGLKIGEFTPKDYNFSGPSYLTGDNNYFYVTDWGNKRIVKFDYEGNHILNITNPNLKGPGGIVILDDILFVADNLDKSLHYFDFSGNLLKTTYPGLNSPEGLSAIEKKLLIADGINVKLYNPVMESIDIVTDLEGKGSRITKASLDVNGNTVITDFNNNVFSSLTDLRTIYGGLFVRIDRIQTINYPNIEIEVIVTDRMGNPVVGLDNSNFLVSENDNILPSRNLIQRGQDTKSVSMGLILDFDPSLDSFLPAYFDLLNRIENERQQNDIIELIKASDLPIIINNGATNLVKSFEKQSIDSDQARCGIDQAIKLASSSLQISSNKRVITIVTDGKIRNKDFSIYSLDEIAQGLKNNNISLNVLYLLNERNEELEYIIKETGGKGSYLFSGTGGKGLLDEARKIKSGYYVLAFNSLTRTLPSDTYIPLGIEINYIRKSGRAESGFYTPIKIEK